MSKRVDTRLSALSIVSLVMFVAAAITATTVQAAVVAPPIHGKFDYQIGGTYQPADDVAIVDRDATDSPTAGRYNICYLNAFQTQPDSLRWWKRHHRNLLLTRNGRIVKDTTWNEALLDTSTQRKRQALAELVSSWVAGCKTQGFDAVEFDNLDSYARSNGRLHIRHNLLYARLLVVSAHSLGLAAAQKNAVELSQRGKDLVGFDFAIAEECQRYHECNGYRRAYGNNMVEIEYTDYARRVFEAACNARGSVISILRRDRKVVPVGHRGYRYETC